MERCKECNTIIYDSHRRRELKKTLINLDKRFEPIVNDLCQHCLANEQTKYLRNKLLERIFKK